MDCFHKGLPKQQPCWDEEENKYDDWDIPYIYIPYFVLRQRSLIQRVWTITTWLYIQVFQWIGTQALWQYLCSWWSINRISLLTYSRFKSHELSFEKQWTVFFPHFQLQVIVGYSLLYSTHASLNLWSATPPVHRSTNTFLAGTEDKEGLSEIFLSFYYIKLTSRTSWITDPRNALVGFHKWIKLTDLGLSCPGPGVGLQWPLWVNSLWGNYFVTF